MKRPTAASLKKVTPDNLVNLGAERLAAILAEVAETRPDVKRRLRMELAAEQGAEHLAVEIDRRLASLDGSRSKVSWRKRASFVGDLDVLRLLIAERLARLDPGQALDRMWRFMDLARRLDLRVRDRDGTLEAVFVRGAGDIGRLLDQAGGGSDAEALVEAIAGSPVRWAAWLPTLIEQAPLPVLETALDLVRRRPETSAGWAGLHRQLADAAGDIDAFQASFSPQALRTPPIAAQVARRLLKAGRVEAAGSVLEAARPAAGKAHAGLGGEDGADAPDFEWETAWIAYLDQAGQGAAAQAARWASFERTLSADRARDFTRRLKDFEDVEAEARAFEYAAQHRDFQRGLQFLMDWPALPAAAAMIAARADDVKVAADPAALWAERLQGRHPAAAETLLRRTAALAFRRRDFATCDRLTEQADAIEAG
jgi:hypothetical protein